MLFSYRNGGCSSNRFSSRRPVTWPWFRTVGLVGVCAAGVTATAQEVAPPGLVTSFDFTQRLEYSDNPDLDVDGSSDFYGRTLLGFGLTSVRPLDRFTLDLSTDIEAGRSDGDSVDPVNSFAGVSYARDVRSSFFRLNSSYREADQRSDNFDDFDLDGNVISQDDGTRQTTRFSAEAGVGQDAPIGASFLYNFADIQFTETDDTSLNDSTTNRFAGQIDFQLNPRLLASLTSEYIDLDVSGDGVDRETTRFGSAIEFDVSPVTTVTASLSYDEIERSGGEEGTDDGFSGGFGWTRDLPNGDVGLSYKSVVASNDDGRRGFLNVSRSLDLPRGGLSVNAGVTGTDTLGSDPLFEIDYRLQNPTSLFTLGMSQEVRTGTDNDEQINTRLRAAYDWEVNNLSRLGLSMTLLDRNELQDDGNDGRRIDIGLTYEYALTRDWGLVTGYRHALRQDDDEEDRRSNTVFIGLQRSFDWSP